MTKDTLVAQIREKQSFLCVGLDPDLSLIPSFLLEFEDPVFEFNRRIIDATKDLCVAYKPNTAFFEALGPKGWISLQKTLDYIPDTHFKIADAKRGDIGNTSRQYAKAFFESLSADAITVAPYMGRDSVEPFLEFPNKWVILLALTSNKGSLDFQMTPDQQEEALYEQVLRISQTYQGAERLMYVIGATHPDLIGKVRSLAPNHFFLVPGVGAQGGDLEAVAKQGMNADVGLLVNSSRGIIYAGNGPDFAEKARESALGLQQQMAALLSKMN
ncbi:MAG: orotidine-5'-phosphate decarboxylase [Saprospiraceae bacterium]|nr:orotidine-5'-phosphate decarboxylase [Saprospiraceae bacterium]